MNIDERLEEMLDELTEMTQLREMAMLMAMETEFVEEVTVRPQVILKLVA